MPINSTHFLINLRVEAEILSKDDPGDTNANHGEKDYIQHINEAIKIKIQTFELGDPFDGHDQDDRSKKQRRPRDCERIFL